MIFTLFILYYEDYAAQINHTKCVTQINFNRIKEVGKSVYRINILLTIIASGISSMSNVVHNCVGK